MYPDTNKIKVGASKTYHTLYMISHNSQVAISMRTCNILFF